MTNVASTSRLSLEDWDALAPLNEIESESVSRIQVFGSIKPIPSHLLQRNLLRGRGEKGSRIDLASLIHSPIASPSRPGSAAGTSEATSTRMNPQSAIDPLEIVRPIETAQQFHDWFAKVEQSMERSQEEVYILHLNELDQHVEQCEMVLEQLEESRGLLSEMEANYKFVEENSRALQLACETMLDEQKHLVEVSAAIGSRLEYFRELEVATRMLNLPGEALVLQDDFLNMLDRLDICLEYLKGNRDFKDAEIYIIRFQQCLTRSMTLIKMYFVSVIRNYTADISSKMAGKDLSETAVNALLYTKFLNTSSILRILVFELEKRARLEPVEYSSLLQECYNTWFASRMSLLSTSLAEEVRRMDPTNSDLIKLARAGCNHLRAVSIAEWALYKELFSTGEDELYRYLENLCDYLYDSLRPRILHEPKLEMLCELCTVLSAMMALDSDGRIEDDDDDDDDDMDQYASVHPDSSLQLTKSPVIDSVPSPANPRSLGRLRFSILLQTVLQDTQTRLVFRAQAVIQSDVLYFTPTAEDLLYPEKLIATREAGLSLWTQEEKDMEGEVSGFRAPREEAQVSWYPTLRRTVYVLSRLDTYVNNTIFEDFAGEAVTFCRQSLSSAAVQLLARTPDNKIDSQLFLIRHFLFLKEMVRSVDLVQIERAADFSSVTDALANLLRNTSVIFNPNALFELASKGMPSFAETMTDAKTDLDAALKRVCEELIADSSGTISLPLRTFLDQCTQYLSTPTGTDLPSQEWASPASVIALHEAFEKGLRDQARAIRDKMNIYLGDEKTIEVLLPRLLDEIVDSYSSFYNLVRSEYDFATSSSLSTPAALKEILDSTA